MEQGVFSLVLGFVLGIKHTFEGDHVAAVSTIVTDEKNPLKAALVGIFWGIGHTTTLFIVGVLVIVLKIQIAEEVNVLFEFLVGVMLVILGLHVFRKSSIVIHSHIHIHDNKKHAHPHFHHKNAFHKHHKSFIVGLFHGMAGSGALMLLVLSTIRSRMEGVYYILLFGAGSILGMTAMSFLVGIPFIYSARKFPQYEKYLRIAAGTLSILFGFYTMYHIITYDTY